MKLLFTLFICASLMIKPIGTTHVSYYAKSITGKKTANGERFHSDSLTCASPSLPFGTKIKLTNPDTKKEVIVRVNDRGPWSYINGKRIPHTKRGFDISLAAFKTLGNPSKGVLQVEYKINI